MCLGLSLVGKGDTFKLGVLDGVFASTLQLLVNRVRNFANRCSIHGITINRAFERIGINTCLSCHMSFRPSELHPIVVYGQESYASLKK